MSESTECPWCGAAFDGGPHGKVRIYCSRRCKERAGEARRRRAKAAARPKAEQIENGPCAWCGGQCEATTGGRKRLTCSQECRQRLRDARKMERYRSDPEYRQKIRDRQTARGRAAGAKPKCPGGESICEWCDESFPSMGHGPTRKRFCSEVCRRRAEKERTRYLYGSWQRVMLTGYLPDGRRGPVEAKSTRQLNVRVFCPDCGLSMAGVDGPSERWCMPVDSGWGCGLRLSFDWEEVECLVLKAFPPVKRAA